MDVRRIGRNTLIAVNKTTIAIFYFIHTTDNLANFLPPPPCVNPATCRRVEPWSSKAIDYSEFGGQRSRTRKALFTWWHIVQKADGRFTFDSVRYVAVGL